MNILSSNGEYNSNMMKSYCQTDKFNAIVFAKSKLISNNFILSIRFVLLFYLGFTAPSRIFHLRGMFEMNCLLSSSSISTWGTIKTNTYLYRVIQYLHNGV